MAAGLIIRPITAGDGAAWQRVFAAVADESLWIGAEPPVPDTGDEMVAKFVGNDDDLLLLARLDGEVVGWISAERQDDGAAELGMGIVEPHRGRGVGSALMDAVVAWAGEHNVDTLVLRVFPHNDRALALYRKFGFVELEHKVGVWPRRNGDFWDLIFMQRTLRPI